MHARAKRGRMTHRTALSLVILTAATLTICGCAPLQAAHFAADQSSTPPAAPATSAPADPAEGRPADPMVAEATVQSYLAALSEWDLGSDTDDLLASMTTSERESLDRASLREGGDIGRSRVFRAAELGEPERTDGAMTITGCLEVRDGLGLFATEDVRWTVEPDPASPTGWAVGDLLRLGTADTCSRIVP